MFAIWENIQWLISLFRLIKKTVALTFDGRLFDKCATIVAETTVWAELVYFERF